jgi:hypothetical protein
LENRKEQGFDKIKIDDIKIYMIWIN